MKGILAAGIVFLGLSAGWCAEPFSGEGCTRENVGKTWAGDEPPPGLTPPAEAGGGQVTYDCISMRGPSGSGFFSIWQASWNNGQEKRVFGKSGWGIPLNRR